MSLFDCEQSVLDGLWRCAYIDWVSLLRTNESVCEGGRL
jgi:hypothetical protein